MFKFDFSDLDLEENENQPPESDSSSAEPRANLDSNTNTLAKHYHASTQPQIETQVPELTLDELAQALPPAFSYSPLVIPLSHPEEQVMATGTEHEPRKNGASTRQDNSTYRSSVTLPRRDLFDARYQLISESDADEPPISPFPTAERLKVRDSESTLKFVDNPSDLVPGLYEGGLKTWECSLDLVNYLAGITSDEGVDWLRGRRVIEIGCGTAIPSLFLLQTIFSQPQRTDGITTSGGKEAPQTQFILQDYNDIVLRLVTFPNVLLTWYSSPLAEKYRSQHTPQDEDEEAMIFDPSRPGDLEITTELLAVFRDSLDAQHISIRFISGSWHSFVNASDNSGLCTFPFDITLTSETIYQSSGLSSLITLLKRCASYTDHNDHEGNHSDDDIVSKAKKLSLEGSRSERVCLVAAKVLYFGVGGGIMEFEEAVEEAGGTASIVLERKAGVGRKVLSVAWS